MQHQNLLGSERFRTNYQGQFAADDAELPFGDGFAFNLVLTGGDQDNNYYAGLDKDLESATEHAQYRQYSHVLGRWMSPDPYDGSYDPTNPQSFDRYNYVLNNPVNATDSLGLDDCGGDDPDAKGVQPEFCLKPPPPPPPPSPCDLYPQFCTPNPTPPPTGPTGPGGAHAPTKPPKSPARQACENAAQQKLAAAINALDSAIPGNLKDSFLEGAAGGAVIGCKTGGVAAFVVANPELSPVTCGAGALAGAIDGAGMGVTMSLSHTILRGIAAEIAYKADMQACAAK